MKIAKKSLSVFLSLLMIITSCSVGLFGISASAAEGDSDYSIEEVAALVNAATASGFTLSSSGNAWNYASDDGKVIAAAEAIFNYAVNTYRDGKEANSKANSSAGLYEHFDATFGSLYANPTAARRLVKNVLNPDGTTVYSYENPAKKTGNKGSETKTAMSEGDDVSGTYPLASYPSYYASTNTENVIKTSSIKLDLNAYLMAYAKIEDIPSTIITSVEYTYGHTYSSSAKVTSVSTRTAQEKDGCDTVTVTYYTPTIETSYWNYMTGKPTRTVVKEKTVKKGLLTLEKYFTEDLLATTIDEMLAMDIEDIKSLFLTTEMIYETAANYNDSVLAHFGFNPTAIHKFMDDVDFAYRVVAAKYNIDILNDYIGSDYDEESYAEMSELYAKTSTAYDVVFALAPDVIDYIYGEGNYGSEYESALALKSAAESYNAVLFDIMTEQKLEETVEAMVATYTEYINVLNKEDIETPTDAEVIGLVQKVEAFDEIIASYTGYSYFRNYWTTAYESEWAKFSGILDEVYEVRGLKMEFETYYDYFLPLIYTTQIDTLDNDAAIALHAELDTKLGELRESYNSVLANWNGTIADKIFNVVYEGEKYLLQTLVDNVKSTGKEAVKTVLIARTEAQLDAVYAYKDTTVVNFDNFASIKSTLTYFDYDLYNYVNGGGEGQNSWLSDDYTNKYAQVQVLLDRYHAFSTSDGKAFFNEDFTFADKNGYYAIRYAGNHLVEVEGEDSNGDPIVTYEQIGYPNDIARNGADDNYYVTEEKMLDTVARIDNFITSRDFGAIIGLTDTETEEYTDLATYINQMLESMLYTEEMMNNLVGMIFPMIVELLETELVGALGNMEGGWVDDDGIPWLNLQTLTGSIGGNIALYLDQAKAPAHDGGDQKDFMEVFAELGLYIFPATLADSLMMSNPVAYGVGTPIYTALKEAGRDWSALVCEDDPETELIDETKVLEFEWGVYDADSFIEVIGCILDAILPLLQAVLTDKMFEGAVSNAAIAYSPELLTVKKVFIRGGLQLKIDPLNAWNTLITPLFEVLGVEKIPTVRANSSGYDIAEALIGTLLKRVDQILADPLSSILDILPNLVYFLSMDSVQEIINSLNIHLNLTIHEVEVIDYDGLLGFLLDGVDGILAGKISFPIDLAVADLLDLYDLLGFEISDFNEILKFALSALSTPAEEGEAAEGTEEGTEEGGLSIDLSGITLPPIKQQEIIFCSDWTTNAAGRVDLESNKGDLMYWFLNYVVSALVPDENGNSLLTALLGDDMDPMISGIIEKVVSQLTGNQNGALAAIIEILNPTTYDLKEMDWIEQGDWDYNGIEGANQMSIVYLNYGNDWTEEKANFLVDNVDALVPVILELAGVEDMSDLGAFLEEKVNGLFTNANITALVQMLGGLGDSPSAIIADIVANQVGIDINSWFTAFGYLYPAETWAEDAEIILPGNRLYVNNFGVEGVANEDGTISWFFNRMPLVDGDGYTFINILSRLLGEASILVDFLFAGGDVSAFEELLTIKGYESYATTFGLLLEVLGVENLPTQADFNADSMGSLTNMLTAVLDWFYDLTSSDTMIKDVLEFIPDLFLYIESNGLSVFLHNLLMPVLVLVDTVRPLIDVDVNGVLSILVSDLLNNGTVNIDAVLEYVVHGIYMNDDVNYKWCNIDIFNLTFTEIIKIADNFLGTNLYESGLVQIGVKGLCSGVVAESSSVGSICKTTVTAADTITIFVTALLDCLSYPSKDPAKTNGDAIFGLIAELTGNADLAGMYPVIAAIISGIEVEYATPDWGYMFENADAFSLTLPEQSIVYLGYTTDWDEEAANGVYSVLDDILDLVLPEVLEEGETLATLLNGLLTDNVYTDEILVTVVELIVNAIAALDGSLRTLVDVMIDTDIASWFSMCKYNEETEKYECTKDWGIDEAAEADKKALFIAGIKEVLQPANGLLAWLFFGDEFAFFTGSEVDTEGNYTYNDIIKLNGGEGYAYGLAPIFEALGCTMAPAADYYDAATGTYNVGNAVEDILNSVLDLVDDITANPVEEVFNLLPNLIYFINADGLKVSVANLLAPVNGIIENLSAFVGDVSLGGLLADVIGIDIENLTTETLLGIAAANDVVLSDDLVDIICNLYVGKLAEFTSANGNKAYRLDVTGAEGDVLTIILSIALDLFNLNADLFSGILGEETYYAVYKLIRGAAEAFTYRDLNWAFMYEGEDAASKLFNEGLPQRVEGTTAYEVYTQYQNNWNEATADYVNTVLDKLVKDITDTARSDGSSLGQLLDDAIVGGLYQDDILNSLIAAVVELIVDYQELIEGAGALLGAESISEWFDYCTITTDANGDTVVTCDKDWGVDSAETNDEKRTAFVEGFVTALKPAYRILAWLLFGEDYTFLNGTTNEVLITITGGDGYDNALVPLLEGLMCTMNYEGTYSGIKPASAFYDAEGNLNMEQAVRDVFTALSDWLYVICGDLANQGETGSLGTMLEILPNFMYFVNADGLKVVVNNLLVPVNSLLEGLKPFGLNVDIASLIDVIDITDVDFYAVFDLLENLLGLYFPDYTQDFFCTFYIGEAVAYESANGKLAYRLAYTEEESRADMITCVISFVVDAFQDPRNDECLIGWMGEDIYNGIIAVLGLQGVKEMQKFSWLFTDFADKDVELNATETSERYEVAYNDIWTREKAEYIADNMLPFVTTILGILGLEINGVKIQSIDDLLDSLLEGNLYTQATADSLLETIRDLVANLTSLEPYGEYIINVLDKAFGVNLAAWDTMTITVVDGDRDSFVAALEEMVAPIVPLLDVLLCGENIELFYTIEDEHVGESALVIYGSEGYAYGIVPLFEALGCTMMAPADFKELSNEDKVGAILDSLLDRVDVILQDPINEIFEMIPELVYFINSNGLDTAVNNILNSVDTVLMALEPLVGATSLMELLGVDLSEINFEYLINLACDAVSDSTGIDIEPLIVNFAAELTVGKVVTYQSANGETYFKMVYAGEYQYADMVTILLRLLIDTLATGDNATAIINLLAGHAESEEAADSSATLIKLLVKGLSTEYPASGSMATLYYIFYGLNTGVQNIGEVYGNYQNVWESIREMFDEENEGSYYDKVGDVLSSILKDFAGLDTDSKLDSCDCDCHSNSAIMRFFFKIANFFRRLFGMNEFSKCECGAKHW